MRSKYVVLRTESSAPNTNRSWNLPFNDGSPPPVPLEATLTQKTHFTVQAESLNRSEVDERRRETDVQDVTPTMPLRLIAPVNIRATTSIDNALVAWGVTAVGADHSAYTGKDVVVAVLDTGIDADHPAFEGVELIKRNFTEEAPEDLHGHGTHCAATIFGRDVEGQRIGVARGVRKALIGKVLGQGADTQSIVEAIKWAADSGAHVISMSLGVDFPGYAKRLRESGFPEELAISRALEAYRANVRLYESMTNLLRAQAYPTLLVAAAGNESQRKVNPHFEVAAAPPATAEGIVSVAAVGRTPDGFEIASFSNTGVILSGPGVDVTSAALGGGLITMSGTSMAAPHVAGVAALWVEKLLRSNQLTLSTLTGKVIGSTTSDGFVPGSDPYDFGAGLVSAP